jgi:hypothetical protein
MPSNETDFSWDPFGTLHDALWIGGGQWAGKSTVARILAARFALTAYHYDYHDARGHLDRRIVARQRAAAAAQPETLDLAACLDAVDFEDYVRKSPERLAFVFDDLRGLTGARPVLAEGWGLRPEVIAPLLDSPDRMIVMVPTQEMRALQLRTMPRVQALASATSDPQLAQANRVARDRILADDAASAARAHGVRVLEVDGSQDAEAVADSVAGHFARYLN